MFYNYIIYYASRFYFSKQLFSLTTVETLRVVAILHLNKSITFLQIYSNTYISNLKFDIFSNYSVTAQLLAVMVPLPGGIQTRVAT